MGQVIWYIPEYKCVLSKYVFFFPKLFSVEFLAQNVVFSFVCLNNLMIVMVSFPT